MADVRSYHLGVALTDNLATPSNAFQGVIAFGVMYDGSQWDMVRGDATNGLLVDLGSNNDVSTELPAAAALSDDFSNPTAPAVGACAMLWDGSAWDRALGDSTDGMLVNLGTNNDVTVSGSVTADTEMSTAAAATDDFSNPSAGGVLGFLMGFDSGNTNWNRVEVDDAGHLQVDVLTGGGVDTPTNPANEYETSAALSAGSSANLDTADLGAKKLSQVEVWCSAPYKAALYTVEDGTPSTDPIAIGGGPAYTGWTWKAPHRNYAAVTANAGVDGFRVAVTNLHESAAADVYATFHYED